MLYGARTALTIGVLSSLVGCSLGALIGITSAYFGGIIDQVIQRCTDILLAFPVIVLALVIVAVFGRNPLAGIDVNLIMAIAIPVVPNVARVIRSSALSIAAMPFIDAARAGGYSHSRIILRRIRSECGGALSHLVSAYIAQAMPARGRAVIARSRRDRTHPGMGFDVVGECVRFLSGGAMDDHFPRPCDHSRGVAFSMLGDSLRDWLDPKFKMR